MKLDKQTIGIVLISCCGLIVLIVLLGSDPLPQDENYHLFSDTTNRLFVPNFLNVLSNLPFLIVGYAGIHALYKIAGLTIQLENKSAYYALFIGTTLVSVGSGYYHLWPSTETLVWDRLPMTIAFMGLFSIVIGEFISTKTGKNLLLLFLIVGVYSVLYWYTTELNGRGDLRLYAVVQFLPLLAIPIILLCFTSKFTQVSAYWWLLAAYLLAKIFEHFDAQIHEFLVVISGHSLKHISAAIGVYILLRSFRTRECLDDST